MCKCCPFFFITACENPSRATRVMWFGLFPFMVRHPWQQLRHISMKWERCLPDVPRKTRDVMQKSMTLYTLYPVFAKTCVFFLHSCHDFYPIGVQSGKIILGNTWLTERYRRLVYDEFFRCFENWVGRFSFGLFLCFGAVSCSLSRPLLYEVLSLPSTFSRSLFLLSCWLRTSLVSDCHILLYFLVSV